MRFAWNCVIVNVTLSRPHIFFVYIFFSLRFTSCAHCTLSYFGKYIMALKYISCALYIMDFHWWCFVHRFILMLVPSITLAHAHGFLSLQLSCALDYIIFNSLLPFNFIMMYWTYFHSQSQAHWCTDASWKFDQQSSHRCERMSRTLDTNQRKPNERRRITMTKKQKKINMKIAPRNGWENTHKRNWKRDRALNWWENVNGKGQKII